MIRSLILILASSSYRRFLSSILLFSFLLHSTSDPLFFSSLFSCLSSILLFSPLFSCTLLLILYSSLLLSFLLHSTSYPLFFSSLVFSPALYLYLHSRLFSLSICPSLPVSFHTRSGIFIAIQDKVCTLTADIRHRQ